MMKTGQTRMTKPETRVESEFRMPEGRAMQLAQLATAFRILDFSAGGL